MNLELTLQNLVKEEKTQRKSRKSLSKLLSSKSHLDSNAQMNPPLSSSSLNSKARPTAASELLRMNELGFRDDEVSLVAFEQIGFPDADRAIELMKNLDYKSTDSIRQGSGSTNLASYKSSEDETRKFLLDLGFKNEEKLRRAMKVTENSFDHTLLLLLSEKGIKQKQKIIGNSPLISGRSTPQFPSIPGFFRFARKDASYGSEELRISTSGSSNSRFSIHSSADESFAASTSTRKDRERDAYLRQTYAAEISKLNSMGHTDISAILNAIKSCSNEPPITIPALVRAIQAAEDASCATPIGQPRNFVSLSQSLKGSISLEDSYTFDDPKETLASKLERIRLQGFFDRTQAIEALDKSNQNVDKAVGYLLKKRFRSNAGQVRKSSRPHVGTPRAEGIESDSMPESTTYFTTADSEPDFQVQLSALCDNGFLDFDLNRIVLRQFSGNLDQALQHLRNKRQEVPTQSDSLPDSR